MLKRFVPVVTIAAIVLVGTTGCVTKKKFRSTTEDTDRRIGSVENAVEQTEQQVADLSKETDRKIGSVDTRASQALDAGKEAMGAAKEAQKLARGKLLWDVTITDGLEFDFGKAQLSPSATTELDDLVTRIKSYGKALYIEIEGHTDNVGPDTLNQRLGEERAAAVRSYLSEQGIPLHAINTISHGESRPVADNSSKSGRAQNRRVVVRVLE
jgi:outer membrane protein OmpA-like peptidoglycan-associated protein